MMWAGALGSRDGLRCGAGLDSKLWSMESALTDSFQECSQGDKPADSTTGTTTQRGYTELESSYEACDSVESVNNRK